MRIPSWFGSLNGSRRKTRSRSEKAGRRPRTRLFLEQLEDRTVPTSVTVLASHLRPDANFFVVVRVPETGLVDSGNDFTFDAAAGTYHLTDYDGGATSGRPHQN